MRSLLHKISSSKHYDIQDNLFACKDIRERCRVTREHPRKAANSFHIIKVHQNTVSHEQLLILPFSFSLFFRRKKMYEPLCSRTSSIQYNSCNLAPWFCTSDPKHYRTQGCPLLEETHPGCNNEEHSSRNGYVTPVKSNNQ